MRLDVLFGLFLTVFLGFVFSALQFFEYFFTTFCINDSIYGSIFFLATGFHGLHVIIGNFFLFVCFLRMVFYHFSSEHHLSFEFAAWYWHMVDCVWLFLFVCIYWWGS